MVSLTHLSSFLVLLIFISVSTCSSQAIKPTPIIDGICKQVSNYTFCVDAIYTHDSRAATADAAMLGQITFSYAYFTVVNATTVLNVLNDNPVIRKNKEFVKSLLHCRANYRHADKTILSAFDLMESEIYFTLKDFPEKFVSDAIDCEKGFKNIGKTSPLTQWNKNLEGIAPICVAVALWKSILILFL